MKLAGRHPTLFRNFHTSRGTIEITIYDFIKEIKNKPVIWNRMHIDHKNNAISELNWKAFGATIVPYLRELDEDEQTLIIDELKNCWLNLRKNLRKSLLSAKKGISSHCHYLRHMEFFLNSQQKYLKDIATEEELQRLLENEIKMRADAGLPPPENLNGKRRHSDDDKDDPVASSSKKPFLDSSPNYRSARLRDKLSLKVQPINPKSTKASNRAEFAKFPATAQQSLCNTSFDPMSLCETTSQQSLEDDSVNEVVHNESQFDYRQQQLSTNFRIQRFNADNGSTNSLDLPDKSYDAHQAFFDSIKPTLRELNDTQKLDFKIEVLKTLKKYKLY